MFILNKIICDHQRLKIEVPSKFRQQKLHFSLLKYCHQVLFIVFGNEVIIFFLYVKNQNVNKTLILRHLMVFLKISSQDMEFRLHFNCLPQSTSNLSTQIYLASVVMDETVQEMTLIICNLYGALLICQFCFKNSTKQTLYVY